MRIKYNGKLIAVMPNHKEPFSEAHASSMSFEELRQYADTSLYCAFELVTRVTTGVVKLAEENNDKLLDYGFDEYNRGYSTALKHHNIGELS